MMIDLSALPVEVLIAISGALRRLETREFAYVWTDAALDLYDNLNDVIGTSQYCVEHIALNVNLEGCEKCPNPYEEYPL